MAALPRSAPAPAFLWSIDRGGWVALGFEDVDGAHPALPWRPGELGRVLDMVAGMAAALTPAPPGFPAVGDRLADLVRDVVVDQVAVLLGRDPEEIDPTG